MASNLRELADAVCAALVRHANAVSEGTGDRADAGPALVAALQRYGLAVVNSGAEPLEELDEFDEWLDEDDGIEQPDPEPDMIERVAVFVRADFAIEDVDELRASAIEQMQSCCPVPTGQDPAEWVRAPAQAVAQLLSHHLPVFEPDQMERHGLRVVAETVLAVPVGPEAEDSEDYPWGALLDDLSDETE